MIEEHSELYDKNIEQIVLCQLLLNPDKYYELSEDLSHDDFFYDPHKAIFRAIVYCSETTITTPLVERELLKHQDKMYDKYNLDIIDFLYDTINRIDSTDGLESHVKSLNSLRVRRGLYSYSNALMEKSIVHSNIFELIDNSSKEISNIDTIGNVNDFSSYECISNTLESILNPTTKDYVYSYIKPLDDFIVGFENPDFVIIAGRPGMGKTSLALNIFNDNFLNNVPGAFFSLEMNKNQLMLRMLASRATVSLTSIRRGHITDYDRQALKAAADEFKDKPFYIDDESTNLSEIVAKMKKLKKKHDIKLVVIDYIQLMETSGVNREAQISSITRKIKQTARELKIVIIGLSQLSRSVENRGGEKRPMLSDLRESGSIEQDADMVIFPYRPAYYFAEEVEYAEEVELIVAKGRSTGTDTVKSFYIPDHTDFVRDPMNDVRVNNAVSNVIRQNDNFMPKVDDEEAPF